MLSAYDFVFGGSFLGNVTSYVQPALGALEIEICGSADNGATQRTVRLSFSDVVECTAAFGVADEPELFDDDCLLWDYNESHSCCYFMNSPVDPLALIGTIYIAHSELMTVERSLARYLNATPDILAGGYGLLSAGPTRLMEHYARAVDGMISLKLVPGRVQEGGYRLLQMPSGYVIFRDLNLTDVA